MNHNFLSFVTRCSLFLLTAPFICGQPVSAQHSQAKQRGYLPQAGFVPDKATAIRIAEAVWLPIYGTKGVKGWRPYVATLQNGVWTVEGTLPPNYVGGTPYAKISKSDARIIEVHHEK